MKVTLPLFFRTGIAPHLHSSFGDTGEVQKVKTNTGGEECVFPRKSKILSIMYKTDEMYTAVSWHHQKQEKPVIIKCSCHIVPSDAIQALVRPEKRVRSIRSDPRVRTATAKTKRAFLNRRSVLSPRVLMQRF
ncbi:hypothetical protein F2P81_020488 [Scophthalmus maximus]|uniref:Uncharacterized protein n=1 Tax=Scophthalmus maximus TaxID=52904 RepID=A0A6A4S3Y9_SCOMX|nr:hypothetical protein F2P81_020488 [Scophthalmus maximus]